MEILFNDYTNPLDMCYTPFMVRDANKNIVPVPCGKCEACIKRRVSGWSFRLMQEDRYSTSSYFITLTYDRKHCPISKNRFMSLRPEHLQLFFKRLRTNTGRYYSRISAATMGRSRVSNLPIKYYSVGEYGTKGGRPHYHLILFNAELSQVSPAWMMGDVHYGQVSGASVGYTLKYLSKSWRPQHRNDDREPQFSRMSQGLGRSYLSPKIKQWHKDDITERMCLTLPDGRKLAMPRYYKDKIYSSEERGFLKGYFEKQLIDQDMKDFNQSKGKHAPSYTSDVKQSFQRIYYQSILNEKI